MRIAFLHMTMGVVNRGSEISTKLIADKLSKNHKVLVIGGGEVRGEFDYQKIIIENSQFSQAPGNIFSKLIFRMYWDGQSSQIKKFTKKSIKYIKSFNPDIIIPINGKLQIQIIKRFFPNKKIVIFGRAGIGWNDKDSLSTSPDLFIALSKKAERWAKEISQGKTRVAHIPNPIDVEKFKSPNSIEIDLPGPIVLVVGALTKYKNIDLVIKAVSKTKASLLILGKGEEEKSLEELAQKLLPKRSVFTHASYQDLPKYYQSADVFCFMPDAQEAFGRVYIEAMAAGLPIVAPDDPIRRSIIGRNGLYSPHRVEDIFKNIKVALDRGRIDYSTQLGRFSSKKVVGQIEVELNKL